MSLQLGMQILVATRDAVTRKTVVNCFRKSKISSESLKAAEDDDPFKELEEEIENLRSIQPDLVSEKKDAASFGDVDVEVLAVQPLTFDPTSITKMQSKLKMYLCIAPTETTF